MPLYSYQCLHCESLHDEVLPLSERDALVLCPCGSDTRRVPALIGVIAHNTKGGNLMHSTTTASTWKGNRKPKTISRGAGLGGHPGRTPPRIFADPPKVEVKR